MHDKDAACSIAKTALNQAVELLDECEQESTREQFQEVQSMITCLQENMNAWGEDDDVPFGDENDF